MVNPCFHLPRNVCKGEQEGPQAHSPFIQPRASRTSPTEKGPLLHAVGVHNRPPQDVPLWHMDSFMLKTIETLWAQEKLLEEFKLEKKSYYQR